MAAVNGSKRPKNTRQAVRRLLHYMGYHKFLLAAVAVLVCISSGANILGTYLLNPVIDRYILPGDIPGLVRMIGLMALMYLAGVVATWGYTDGARLAEGGGPHPRRSVLPCANASSALF